LNVRTYVTRDGKPGVFFFSLDAANPVAVAVARALYNLPYYHAHMRVRVRDEQIDYASRRIHPGAPPATFAAVYGPAGPPASAEPGSLANWLTARYCLYTADRRGRLYRQEIDHLLWPLQPATATISANTMTEPLGLTLPAAPPLLHFSRRLDVVIWPQERLPATGPSR
jgi:uncharacterized protein YqjF (DUF2071 family)